MTVSLTVMLEIYLHHDKPELYLAQGVEAAFTRYLPQLDIDQISLLLQIVQKIRGKQTALTPLFAEKLSTQAIKKLIPQEQLDQIPFDLLN